MDAKEYLKKVRDLHDELEIRQLELQQLQDLETSMNSPLDPNKVQCSSPSDKLGNNVSKRIDFEREVVKKAEEEFFNYRDECVEVLKQVKEVNFTHYKVLHLHYINYLSLKKIAKKEGYCYQYTKELHLAALENVQKILNLSKVPT